MRLLISAVAALALTACGGEAAKPADTAAKPADTAKPADAMAGHDMAAMDPNMKMSDSTDDTNTAETPANYTFHTFPAKVESVHLPAVTGETWTATADKPDLVEVGEAKDETMPDGKLHHVVKVTPKSAGNAVVKFERHKGTEVTETRTINFMVH